MICCAGVCLCNMEAKSPGKLSDAMALACGGRVFEWCLQRVGYNSYSRRGYIPKLYIYTDMICRSYILS
jgi:hypothetical protein